MDSTNVGSILGLHTDRELLEGHHRLMLFAPERHPCGPSIMNILGSRRAPLGTRQHGVQQEQRRRVAIGQRVQGNLPPNMLRQLHEVVHRRPSLTMKATYTARNSSGTTASTRPSSR